MSRALTIVLASLALTACTPGQPAQQGDAATTVQVSGAVCRPTPTGRQMTGCYLTVTAAADDRLMSVSSPVAGRAEIHESRIENSMMVMYQLRDGLPLPAGQTVELAPGGNHIMLLAVAEPLKAGGAVPLTLTFASAAPVEITAAVGQPTLKDAGDAAH